MQRYKSLTVVQIPERNRYIFANMEVGDHMYFDEYKVAESARVSAIRFSKKANLNWKFSRRKMKDGWRIFRIA